MPQTSETLASPKALIAIVEDDESLRPALSALVRSLGYDSAEFGSAEAFLSSDARLKANCLVSDFQLPGLSGLDLAGKFRGMLPVIMITARTELALESLARDNDVMCLLRKPFETDELAVCIRRALDSFPYTDEKDNRGSAD